MEIYLEIFLVDASEMYEENEEHPHEIPVRVHI